MKQIPLSVVILAQNDSPQLHAAIQSVAFANEVIVVDTSENKTVRLPKLSRATLRFLPKITDFSATRNQTFTYTQNEWVFFLDSDERCIVPDSDVFSTLFQKNVAAYKIKREDYFLGKKIRYGETAQSWPTRLLHKNHCVFTGSVHEVVVCDENIVNIDPQIIRLTHYSHSSISSFFSKIYWYSNLEALQRNSSFGSVLFQMIFFPPAKWLNNFVFKRGFLDGYRGLVYSTLMSYHSFFVRLFQLEKFILRKST